MAKYFTDDEFRCKCCGGLPPNGMDKNLVQMLDEIRESLGRPLIINCAYRCPQHNEEVGGVPNSQHVLGCAADVDASEIGVEILARTAEEHNADGVGRYFNANFVHIDTRSGRVGDEYRWSE